MHTNTLHDAGEREEKKAEMTKLFHGFEVDDEEEALLLILFRHKVKVIAALLYFNTQYSNRPSFLTLFDLLNSRVRIFWFIANLSL